MTRIQAILLGLLALGAASVPGFAFAAPSATCTEADGGGLDISGTLPSTVTITRTPAAGETFFATLTPGVTNSLLIVNGKTLFSGQTTGTRSFKGTGAPITIVYDIQGTGAMRFSCEEAPPDPDPGPDPDPDPDPPGPPSSASKTTEKITSANSPLAGVGGGPGVFDPEIYPGVRMSQLPVNAGSGCAPVVDTGRLATLTDSLEDLRKRRAAQEEKLEKARADLKNAEDEMVTVALLGAQLNVPYTLGLQANAREAIEDATTEIAAIDKQIELKEIEEAHLRQCAANAGSASQYAATDYAPNSPLAAFGLFDSTQMLIDEDGLRAWASSRASLLGGGPSDLAGAQGAMSVGAAKRLNDTTGIGGEIGIAGGRTRIGADNTTADFTALSAMIAASHEVAESVQLSFGAAGGFAWNSVDMGGATGSFGSTAISGFASISGRHDMNGIVIAPSASLSASNTQSQAYTLSDSTDVGATSVSQLDISGLVRISKSLEMVEADMTLDPFVAFGAGYGIVSGGSLGGLSGSLSLGLNGSRPDGIGFGLSGVFGGTASGVWSAGISGSISGSF